MPPNEYASGGGGKLKLKGSKVSDGRVDKKKKKAKKREKQEEQEENATKGNSAGDDDGRDLNKNNDNEGPVRQSQGRSSDEEVNTTAQATAVEEDGGVVVGKTEAERKYEDAKKKRVCFIPLSSVSHVLYPFYLVFSSLFCSVSVRRSGKSY